MNMFVLRDVFKQALIPTCDAQFGKGEWKLLHDNVGYHHGQVVSDLLTKHKVELVGIPPYSPDLNPIENLWSILKHNVEARNPTSFELLAEYVMDEWSLISTALCRDLAASMIHRVQAVRDCRGHRTGY